jgi:hypothetical protein
MLSDRGSEPETFARRAILKPPVRLVRGPRVRIDGATSSRSHRDRADLGTHLSPEHRNSYVRDSDVHQTFSPLRDDNTTEALYPPAVSLSTPKFLAGDRHHEKRKHVTPQDVFAHFGEGADLSRQAREIGYA